MDVRRWEWMRCFFTMIKAQEFGEMGFWDGNGSTFFPFSFSLVNWNQTFTLCLSALGAIWGLLGRLSVFIASFGAEVILVFVCRSVKSYVKCQILMWYAKRFVKYQKNRDMFQKIRDLKICSWHVTLHRIYVTNNVLNFFQYTR